MIFTETDPKQTTPGSRALKSLHKMSKKTNKPKIERVWIEHKHDDDPDLSYLGGYQRSPFQGFYVNRETGHMRDIYDGVYVAEICCTYGRNELQYISGFQHYGESAWAHVSDKEVASAYLHCRYRFNGHEGNKRGNLFECFSVVGWKTAQSRAEKIRVLNIVYCCCDAERLEDYERGDWHCVGVIAKAEVVSANGVVQTLHSGGIWGVESDAGDYLTEVGNEQLEELKAELGSFGFGARAIAYAFKGVERP